MKVQWQVICPCQQTGTLERRPRLDICDRTRSTDPCLKYEARSGLVDRQESSIDDYRRPRAFDPMIQHHLSYLLAAVRDASFRVMRLYFKR